MPLAWDVFSNCSLIIASYFPSGMGKRLKKRLTMDCAGNPANILFISTRGLDTQHEMGEHLRKSLNPLGITTPGGGVYGSKGSLEYEAAA